VEEKELHSRNKAASPGTREFLDLIKSQGIQGRDFFGKQVPKITDAAAPQGRNY